MRQHLRVALLPCLLTALTLFFATPARAFLGGLIDFAIDCVTDPLACPGKVIDKAVDTAKDVGGVFSGPVDPINDLLCRRYAQAAANAVQRGVDQGCGFGNAGRFTTNYAAHLSWCTWAANDGDTTEIDAEWAARDRAVRYCGGCQETARKAVEQAKENELFGCGGTGARWSTSFIQQLHSCIGSDAGTQVSLRFQRYAMKDLPAGHRFDTPPQATPVNPARLQYALGELLPPLSESDETVRGRFLAECKGFKSPEDIVYCKGYAQRAVNNAVDVQRRDCGLPTDGRFSTDLVMHFQWCMKPENASVREGEDRARADGAATCTAAHPPRDCKSCHSTGVTPGASVMSIDGPFLVPANMIAFGGGAGAAAGLRSTSGMDGALPASLTLKGGESWGGRNLVLGNSSGSDRAVGQPKPQVNSSGATSVRPVKNSSGSDGVVGPGKPKVNSSGAVARQSGGNSSGSDTVKGSSAIDRLISGSMAPSGNSNLRIPGGGGNRPSGGGGMAGPAANTSGISTVQPGGVSVPRGIQNTSGFDMIQGSTSAPVNSSGATSGKK